MKLFTVGPVEMFNRTLTVASQQLPYFRTKEFSDIMFEIEFKIKKMVYTSDLSKVAIITASGTGAMESVISSSFDETDKLLIINGGSFGKRFCELCDIYNIQYETINLEFGEELTKKHFEYIDGSKFSALVVNIHETSTGQLYDINIISEFAKKYNLYLVVDAISSFLADEIKMDSNNIDCMICSSQKGLALSPGISIVIMNNKFYNKINNILSKTMYFDLKLILKNMERGQTPFTPAVGIILELYDRLLQIEEIGIEKIIEDTKNKAMYFRKLIEKNNNFEIPKYPLSNTVTPIICKNNNAKEIFTKLKDEYEIYVTPSGGKLEQKLLRIGHIGNIKEEDFKELVYILERIS